MKQNHCLIRFFGQVILSVSFCSSTCRYRCWLFSVFFYTDFILMRSGEYMIALHRIVACCILSLSSLPSFCVLWKVEPVSAVIAFCLFSVCLFCWSLFFNSFSFFHSLYLFSLHILLFDFICFSSLLQQFNHTIVSNSKTSHIYIFFIIFSFFFSLTSLSVFFILFNLKLLHNRIQFATVKNNHRKREELNERTNE